MQKNNRLSINFFTRKHKVECENGIVYSRITSSVKLVAKFMKGPYKKTKRSFLTERGLTLIEETTFWGRGHERVKDTFLFSCYTGWPMVM